MKARYKDIEFRIVRKNDGGVVALTPYNQLMLDYDVERQCIVQCVSYTTSTGVYNERRKNARYKDIPGAIKQPCEPVVLNIDGQEYPIAGQDWNEHILPVEITDSAPIMACTHEDIKWSVWGERYVERCVTPDESVTEPSTDDVPTEIPECGVIYIDHNNDAPMERSELEASPNLACDDNDCNDGDNGIEASNHQPNETHSHQRTDEPNRTAPVRSKARQLTFWCLSVAVVIWCVNMGSAIGHSVFGLELLADMVGVVISSVSSVAGVIMVRAVV